MQRARHHVVRSAVVTALSALLLVLSGSTAGAAQVPNGAVAHRTTGVHHRSASTEPGPAPAAVAQAARVQQPHRLGGAASALPAEHVVVPRAHSLTDRTAAPADPMHATTRITRDGRAPPA